jgi:hypothetical protein
MIYNFYIDKKLTNLNDNFVDIKLEHPLICDEFDEYFKIKLIDFSYLNNEYNISQKLENNVIKLEKTPIIKIVNFTDIPNTYDYTNNIMYDIYDIDYELTEYSANITYTNEYQLLTGNNYKIYYYDNELIADVDNFANIFNGDSLNIVDDDKYFVIESLTDLKILKKISYGIYFDGTTLPTDVVFTLNIQGSNNGVDYINIDYLLPTGFTITFLNGSNTAESKVKNDKDLFNDIPFKFYRFKLYNSLPSNENNVINSFRFNLLNVEYAPYEFIDMNLSPVIIERVIPDGFYNSVNYVSKINELLANDNIVLSLDNITNKLFFKNNNITPEYTQTDTDYNGIIRLYLDNNNLKKNIGLTNDYNLIGRENGLLCEKNINLVNFVKLVLSTDLTFQNKTHNSLIDSNTKSTGIGNILCWIANDGVPMSYINYTNYNNVEYVINDNVINNISLYFYNENKQKLNIDNALIHCQVIKQKKNVAIN